MNTVCVRFEREKIGFLIFVQKIGFEIPQFITGLLNQGQFWSVSSACSQHDRPFVAPLANNMCSKHGTSTQRNLTSLRTTTKRDSIGQERTILKVRLCGVFFQDTLAFTNVRAWMTELLEFHPGRWLKNSHHDKAMIDLVLIGLKFGLKKTKSLFWPHLLSAFIFQQYLDRELFLGWSYFLDLRTVICNVLRASIEGMVRLKQFRVYHWVPSRAINDKWVFHQQKHGKPCEGDPVSWRLEKERCRYIYIRNMKGVMLKGRCVLCSEGGTVVPA